MAEEKEFDWKGEDGDKFAEHNPYTPEGVDKKYIEYFGKPYSVMLKKSFEALFAAGLDKKTAKVLDIGCSTGGNLSILERMGFKPSNLYGVDMSPKAVLICNKVHPEYHVKEVSGFDYTIEDVESFDLVYHSAVLCQIPQEDYPKFFGKIRSMKPKFYFFIEGINPRGYEKIPNSVAHGHGHKHDHGDSHKHGHGHGHKEGHGHEKPTDVLSEIMDEGFHHVNNVPKVVKEHLPEAKELSAEKFDFPKKIYEEWFKPMHMEYSMVAAYKMG